MTLRFISAKIEPRGPTQSKTDSSKLVATANNGVIQNFPFPLFTSKDSLFHTHLPPVRTMSTTDLSSPPSTADPHIFTIKAATLKFDTRESLEPYVTPLIENPVEEVYLSGNTYGIEACAYLGEILARKTTLKVPSILARFSACLNLVSGVCC